jgi:Fic family protein
VTSQRHSKAEEPPLITDEDERAAREAENALRQFDAVLDLIDEVERDGRPFRLRVSTIQMLHRLALDGLSRYAGTWRPGPIEIGLSKHTPPQAHLVAGLMEELCDWVNEHWSEETALSLCAYVMWRLNWIHPFDDGNGRTSRAVYYLVLCAKSGARLPGKLTIPEIIASNKEPYYDALEKIDEAEAAGAADLTPMKSLLEDCLARQLMEAWEAATGGSFEGDKGRILH